MTHTEDERKTLAELAISAGWKYDTLWKKAKREYPSVKWTANTEVPADIAGVLTASGRRNSAKRSAPRKAAPVKDFIRIDTPAPVTPAPAEPGPNMAPARREWMLYGLMFAATAASVQNMYRVTAELSEANMSAVLLTAVLSVSAIVFVLSGVRRWWTFALAALLIAYESMCNMTRIHAGLYAKSGYPTRFLGQFCNTFGSGTDESAFFLAAFTAFFIAAVQYAAVFELNKK